MREVGLARWQGYSEMTDDLLARLAREADRGDARLRGRGRIFLGDDRRQDRSQHDSDRGDARRGYRRADAHRVGAHRRDRPGGDGCAARHRSDRAHHGANGASPKARSSGKQRGRSPRSARSTRSPAAPTRRRALREAKQRSIPSARAPISPSSSPADRPSASAQFEITGLSKYEPSLVRNYSTIAPGNAVQRRRAQPIRAAPQRVRIFRERAGEDRSGNHAPGRCDGEHRGDRSAAEALRRRHRILDRRPVPRERELSRRELRRPRTAVPGRRAARNQDPVGIAQVPAPAQRVRLDRDVLRRAPSAPTSKVSSRARRRSARAGTRSRNATSARSRRRTISTSSSPKARPSRRRTRSTRNTSGTGAASTTSSRRRRATW